MPAVMSREGPERGAVIVPAANPEQLKGAWRAVLRSWYRTHPEELHREDPEQIEPGA